MADTITNTLTPPQAGVDFSGTPTRGSNKLVTQFVAFETDTDNLLNSLTALDTTTNTLEA